MCSANAAQPQPKPRTVPETDQAGRGRPLPSRWASYFRALFTPTKLNRRKVELWHLEGLAGLTRGADAS